MFRIADWKVIETVVKSKGTLSPKYLYHSFLSTYFINQFIKCLELIHHAPDIFVIIHQYTQHSTRCIRENKRKCNVNIPCTCIGHAGSSVGKTCRHAVNIWHGTERYIEIACSMVLQNTIHYITLLPILGHSWTAIDRCV